MSNKRRNKPPSAAERARRATQRSSRSARPKSDGLTPVFNIDPSKAPTEAKEEALHIDSRDWREARIQGREQEIIEAAGGGDTARAKEILDEVRSNTGGCDLCGAKPAEGEGFVLSTTAGRVERRWGHRQCLEGKADEWLANGQAPIWTPGTSIFDNPNDLSVPHVATTASVRPTLFEFAGGMPAFEALASAHHARCLADPELNHPFSHPDQHPQHVERLAAYWAEVMGGPPAYSESCGDQSGVLRMHSGNGDLGDMDERFVRCFDLAADDAGLPADPEFRAALHDYMTWAVSDVLTYSPVGAVVPDGARMPRWGWDGLQP